MNVKKKDVLLNKGWKFGTVEEFLGLSPEESAFIEMRISISKRITKLRKSKSISQNQLAQIMGSSQSRISKIEKADPNVSIDLMLKALLAMGDSIVEIFESFISERKRVEMRELVIPKLHIVMESVEPHTSPYSTANGTNAFGLGERGRVDDRENNFLDA